MDLSKKYGFKIKACKPYRPQSKGKVERFNSYVKHSFVIPLITSFKQDGLDVDTDILNAKVGPWLKDEANKRIHGSTKAIPVELLKEEQTYFMPLPKITEQVIVPPKSNHSTTLQPNPDVYDALLLEGFV